ncbi:MAG: hypothetical protein IBX56_14565 [Methylomicrobium sp.]|nr:hypothetical protein [Methylomicrobium sp.]
MTATNERRMLLGRAYLLKYELKCREIESGKLIDMINGLDRDAGLSRRELDELEADIRWLDFLQFCNTGRFPVDRY